MLFNILTLSISLLALISSFFIGKKQFELSKMQAAAQNKVELYLLCQPITLKDMDGRQPNKMVPSISIINIGKNVIYLDKYSFNGREYPLRKEVLPPVSAFNGIHYIFLPTDGQRMYHSKLIFMIGKTSTGKQKVMLIFETGNGK